MPVRNAIWKVSSAALDQFVVFRVACSGSGLAMNTFIGLQDLAPIYSEIHLHDAEKAVEAFA